MSMLKNFPLMLRTKRRWVNCLLKDRGKLQAKCPVNKNYTETSVTNSDNFKYFSEAASIAENGEPGMLGVGFVFRYSKKLCYVGVDLDFDPNDAAAREEALSFAKVSKTYWEWSLNGGIHVYGKLANPRKLGFKFKHPTLKLKYEVYTHSRYFVVTGNKGETARDAIKSIEGLVENLQRMREKGGSEPASDNESDKTKERSPQLSDEDILSLISASKQSLQFTLLHTEGELKGHNNDHSAAVFAWHNIVAFYTQDLQQITRLFYTCALCDQRWRQKWDRVCKEQHRRILKDLLHRYHPNYNANGACKYAELATEFLGPIKRDIFSDESHVFHEGCWKNIFDDHTINHLKILVQERKNAGYGVTSIVPALTRHMHTLTPEFLIDIPEWDGTDYIQKLSQCLVPRTDGLLIHNIAEIYKEFMANLWAKINNPRRQNFCPILVGPQGVGKDVWMSVLVGGLKEFQGTFTLSKHDSEKQLAEVMTQRAAVIISEFDKTQDIGSAALKDAITTDSFTFRAAYARRARRFWNRCSLLAACNQDQVLTDVTGNRRFAVIKIEDILWDYPQSEAVQLQVLSQARHLCSVGYKMSAETRARMEQLGRDYTPEDTTEILLEAFDDFVLDKLANSASEYSLYSYNDIAGEVGRLARNFQIRTTTILQLLKATGRQYRHKTQGRFYGLKEHASSDVFKSKRRNFVESLKNGSSFSDLSTQSLD